MAIFDSHKDNNDSNISSNENTNYNRWGKNYINSFRETHKDKRCNNFKDASIQSYGGELFNKIIDNLNDIYDNLPAPLPSNNLNNNIDNNTTRSTAINFSQSFNSQNNGCFHGNTNVIMADYNIKKIKDIKKGDELLDKDNKVSTVVCLIKMKCTNNKCFFSEIKGIKENFFITPYHPVIDINYPSIIRNKNYNWIFPYTISINSTLINCDYIYNLVLNTNHNIIAENTVCVTLGHNFNSNFVISHDYFGTNKVIDDLSRINGYENGLVYLEGNYVERSSNMGHIIKYKQ